MHSGFPWEKRASVFWLAEFKGEPLPKKENTIGTTGQQRSHQGSFEGPSPGGPVFGSLDNHRKTKLKHSQAISSEPAIMKLFFFLP